jgi:LemA protein
MNVRQSYRSQAANRHVAGAGHVADRVRHQQHPDPDEQAKAAWGQVQNQYQRRADLIPNLVETVKGYAPSMSRKP